MVFGTLLRPIIRYAGRTIYQALKVQDRIIDKTYRKAGLYNRGVVRGIQHGLAGGQIIGGLAQLGLNAPDTPGNGNGFPQIQPRKLPQTYKSYKTRRRPTVCYPPRRSARSYNRIR